MMKKLFGILLLSALLLFSVMASAELPMVVDDAGLFTAGEISEMETYISRIRTKYQIDGAVLTTRLSSRSDSSLVDYADRWYEDNGYGLGKDRAGFVFMIDMGNRYYHLSTAGVMIDYITDNRMEKIKDAAVPLMRTGSYGQAVIAALNRIERFLQTGIEEGHFRYDDKTGQRLTGLYNRLTISEMLFSLLGGAVAALLLIVGVMSRYSLKNGTYHFNKQTQSHVNITENTDHFLRRSVSRVRMPPPGSGGHGGHGGGGGGRGSGVHISSGGMSHGGGGGHF